MGQVLYYISDRFDQDHSGTIAIIFDIAEQVYSEVPAGDKQLRNYVALWIHKHRPGVLLRHPDMRAKLEAIPDLGIDLALAPMVACTCHKCLDPYDDKVKERMVSQIAHSRGCGTLCSEQVTDKSLPAAYHAREVTELEYYAASRADAAPEGYQDDGYEDDDFQDDGYQDDDFHDDDYQDDHHQDDDDQDRDYEDNGAQSCNDQAFGSEEEEKLGATISRQWCRFQEWVDSIPRHSWSSIVADSARGFCTPLGCKHYRLMRSNRLCSRHNRMRDRESR